MTEEMKGPPPAQEAEEKKREAIKGVFSTQEVKKVGAGTTTRKTIQKAFWYVEEKGEMIEIQPLNANYVPSGPKRKVTLEDVIDKFQPEPEFYFQTVFPKMKELNQTISRADRHRSRGEEFSAEYEYTNALNVDEENVRANFGLGLTYLAKGEPEKADNIFERLVKLDAAFDNEHKHLFNEFGINLRKNRMYTQAVDYYNRALELSGGDDHLHYNMARACFEKEDYEACTTHLLKCLASNPTLEAAIKFLMWLKQKEHILASNMEEVDQQLAKSAQAIKDSKELLNGGSAASAPAQDASAAPSGEESGQTDAEEHSGLVIGDDISPASPAPAASTEESSSSETTETE